jgi:hypothetical protein
LGGFEEAGLEEQEEEKKTRKPEELTTALKLIY